MSANTNDINDLVELPKWFSIRKMELCAYEHCIEKYSAQVEITSDSVHCYAIDRFVREHRGKWFFWEDNDRKLYECKFGESTLAVVKVTQIDKFSYEKIDYETISFVLEVERCFEKSRKPQQNIRGYYGEVTLNSPSDRWTLISKPIVDAQIRVKVNCGDIECFVTLGSRRSTDFDYGHTVLHLEKRVFSMPPNHSLWYRTIRDDFLEPFLIIKSGERSNFV